MDSCNSNMQRAIVSKSTGKGLRPRSAPHRHFTLKFPFTDNWEGYLKRLKRKRGVYSTPPLGMIDPRSMPRILAQSKGHAQKIPLSKEGSLGKFFLSSYSIKQHFSWSS